MAPSTAHITTVPQRGCRNERGKLSPFSRHLAAAWSTAVRPVVGGPGGRLQATRAPPGESPPVRGNDAQGSPDARRAGPQKPPRRFVCIPSTSTRPSASSTGGPTPHAKVLRLNNAGWRGHPRSSLGNRLGPARSRQHDRSGSDPSDDHPPDCDESDCGGADSDPPGNRHPSRDRTSATGKSIVMLVPWPSRDATLNWPFMSFTTPATAESPSPVPRPASLVV